MQENKVELNTIGIVGAGLTGSLLSIYLAKRGISSHIYERRGDMRQEKMSAGRSINLAISLRGLHALREVGVEEEVLKQAIPMRGRMIHIENGDLAFQPYGMNDSECINSISRGGLNCTLMNFAEKTGKVNIQFNHKVLGMDFNSGSAKIRDEIRGAEFEAQHQTIIGTDGSASAIRQDMIKLPGFEFSQNYLEHGYKELTIPASRDGGFRIEKNALHIWPRGNYMLIALPNFDGSFTCTLFLPFHGPVSFESLNSPGKVSQFFKENFTDVTNLIQNLEETFFENPTGQMVTIKTYPWSVSDKALLLGDAAHAIVPFFGQGMNCGFEDCSTLNQILNQKNQWGDIFSEFGKLRKTNTDAIADMAVENFLEMRDKVGNPKFLIQKSVEKLLQQFFPGEYISRYSLVTFSRISYRSAYEIGSIQDEILAELCSGIETPEEINLDHASKLIRSKLNPIFEKQKGY